MAEEALILREVGDTPPGVGDIVLYRVGEFDSPDLRHNNTEGLDLPAIVVRAWTETCLNLKVLTDGPIDAWKTSVVMGDGPGEWRWPPRLMLPEI